MKFTIFTPTYNRKELLKKLYESLQKQTFKDFEWLIVDDGSVDGTEEAVKEFINDGILDIKYHFKENGGKQRAYNFATDRTNGELFICLDSDDEYVENGLETILKYWEQFEYVKKSDIAGNSDMETLKNIKKLEKKNTVSENSDYGIAGMGYLSTYPDGKIIGSAFPENEMISTQFEIYNKYGVSGDKGLMFRTDIIKKYKFPVFDDEKFITEATVYNRICQNYKMLYINEKIEIKEYQNDGLTAKYNKLLLKNPKGQALYHNEINLQNLSFKQKILNNAVYYKFCKAAGYKFSKIFSESKNKLFLIAGIPIGEYMWRKEKSNIEK